MEVREDIRAAIITAIIKPLRPERERERERGGTGLKRANISRSISKMICERISKGLTNALLMQQ